MAADWCTLFDNWGIKSDALDCARELFRRDDGTPSRAVSQLVTLPRDDEPQPAAVPAHFTTTTDRGPP